MTRINTTILSALLPLCAFLAALFLTVAPARAQLLEEWQARVTQTQAEQPHWVTPLVTVTPRLEQEFRFDVLRQEMSTGHQLVNLGAGKGLELIPSSRLEIIIAAPPAYLLHHNPEIKDGFGDETF